MIEQSRFKEWYGKNKDTLNEKRRKKYRDDSEYREQALKNRKDNRAKQKQGKHTQLTRQFEYQGKTYTVISVGTVARNIGVSEQTIKNWQKRGWIPKPVFESNWRWYTKTQANRIATLHTFLKGKRHELIRKYGKDAYGLKLDYTVQIIKDNWVKHM